MSIEDIEKELFLLDMKDHFTDKDFERRRELTQKLEELKNESE